MLLPREQSNLSNLMIPTKEPILASDEHHPTCTGSLNISFDGDCVHIYLITFTLLPTENKVG